LARAGIAQAGLFNQTGDPGDDDTAISLDPALSALCQAFIGKLNTYDPPRPNVDQIRDDTLVPAGSQTGCAAAQNETTIAVNPLNPWKGGRPQRQV